MPHVTDRGVKVIKRVVSYVIKRKECYFLFEFGHYFLKIPTIRLLKWFLSLWKLIYHHQKPGTPEFLKLDSDNPYFKKFQWDFWQNLPRISTIFLAKTKLMQGIKIKSFIYLAWQSEESIVLFLLVRPVIVGPTDPHQFRPITNFVMYNNRSTHQSVDFFDKINTKI